MNPSSQTHPNSPSPASCIVTLRRAPHSGQDPQETKCRIVETYAAWTFPPMSLSCRSNLSFMPQTFHRARRMRASMRHCSPASSTPIFWRRTHSCFRKRRWRWKPKTAWSQRARSAKIWRQHWLLLRSASVKACNALFRFCSRAIRANASPAWQSRTLRRSSSWERRAEAGWSVESSARWQRGFCAPPTGHPLP